MIEVSEALVRQLLEQMGEDVEREGLVDTPKRVAKFWKEFLDYDPGNLETVFESVSTDQMVVVRNIHGWSFCEHHILPFRFVAQVGYLTGDKVIGLSKIPRIVVKAGRSLQLQERLTHEIADEIERIINPKGVAVLIEGWHTCMMMRGIQAREASMVTSCLRGEFMNAEVKEEFFRLIGK